MIERLVIPGAPAPMGPYSPAVRAGDFIFVSGQGSVDPMTNKIVLGDIREETRMTLNNIKRILEGCGSSLADVVKCNVYLTHASDFAAMNEVYSEFFGDQKPARATIQCGMVMPEMKVEIECTAYVPAK